MMKSKRLGIRPGMDGIQAFNLQLPAGMGDDDPTTSQIEGNKNPERSPSLAENIFISEPKKEGSKELDVDLNNNNHSINDESKLTSLHEIEQPRLIATKRYCCCVSKKICRTNKINPKKMKSREKWMRILRRIELAVCFINVLKDIYESKKKEKEENLENQASNLLGGVNIKSYEIDEMDPMLRGDNPIASCVYIYIIYLGDYAR